MTTIKQGHKAADAMDWNEAMQLVNRLYEDKKYRDCLLIAAGCNLGLRVSDMLQLRWSDLLSDEFTLKEKKTGKERSFRVNSSLQRIAISCRKPLGKPAEEAYVFVAEGKDKPISRQAVDLILKRIRVKYHIKSAKVFSSHTLRKTFGRRIWLQECDKGRGEQALLLLCDVFGHSSISITKRYLGIRQEEIMSVYDSLNIINYAAYCIANGNKAYTHAIKPIQELIRHKQETFCKDKYNVSGEELYWMKLQLYHRNNIVTVTKQSIFDDIKRFLRYASKMGYITVSERDLKRIKTISARRILNPRSLSMQEIKAIDEAFDTLASKAVHYRYSKIIFHIQLNSEARIGEICSILLDTITFYEDGTCSVLEKIKNNGRDMMPREYNTEATSQIRQAMDLSREIRQSCPVGGPRENIFLYTNDEHNANHYAIMDVNRYNGDLKLACKIANVARINSGNVRDTAMTARKRLARKTGLTDMETGAFVGHIKKVSTNSYDDMDFRDVLQAARGINIGTKK